MARARCYETILDSAGNRLVGATVDVFQVGTTTVVTGTMWDAVTAGNILSNPLTTDSNGSIVFYMTAPQNVDLRVTLAGYPTRTFGGVHVEVNPDDVNGLTLSLAASKLVPGATSFSLRNNADSADNLILTDAGAATFRSTVGGITTLTATTLAGTLSTAAQPNVTSLGSLTGLTVTGATTVNVANANALAVGPNGVTNPTLQINTATASAATGLAITAAAAGARVALAVISSGVNEGLSLDAKGSGTIRLGQFSTGNIQLDRTMVGTLDLTFQTQSGQKLAIIDSTGAALLNVLNTGSIQPAVKITAASGDLTIQTLSGQKIFFEDSTSAGLMDIFNTGIVDFPQVGTTASAANAFLNNASSPANSLLRSTSSLRYKRVLGPLTLAEARRVILGLEAIRYRSRAKADDPKREYVGFGAEPVAALDSRFTTIDGQGRPDWVQYQALTAPLSLMAADHERRLEELERRLVHA